MRSFKSSSTEATDALDGLNLNDGEDDEYDFMDESDEGGESAQRSRTRQGQARSKTKYLNVLQDVADRKTDHVVIDLDDLDQVNAMHACCQKVSPALTSPLLCSTRRHSTRRNPSSN